MIDIHTHILPFIDDGADSYDTALIMAEMAADSGVTHIVATPHSSQRRAILVPSAAEIEERVAELNNEIIRMGIDVKILPGMEILADPDTAEHISAGRFPTINNTKYVLIEFEFDAAPDFCDKTILNLISFGYKPVIAHPERYFAVQHDIAVAVNWASMGCVLQLDKQSMLGGFGRREKRAAAYMLEADVVSVVASDAHGAYSRTTSMEMVQDYLTENFSHKYMKKLLEDNPLKIIMGAALED